MMMGTAWINYALVWYLLEQLELLSQSQLSLSLFSPLPEGPKYLDFGFDFKIWIFRLFLICFCSLIRVFLHKTSVYAWWGHFC